MILFNKKKNKGSRYPIFGGRQLTKVVSNLPNIFKTRFVLWLVLWWRFEVKLFCRCTVLPFSRFIIVLDRNFTPIRMYRTVISDIGAKKNKTVANSKECWSHTRSSTTVHHRFPFGFPTMPVCRACGTAKLIDSIQIKKMYLMARDNFDIVCDRNGWHIATYRSIVNAVTGIEKKENHD